MPMNDEVRKAVEAADDAAKLATNDSEGVAQWNLIRAELTRLTEIADSVDPLVIRLGEVTTELEAARKDAERYRWMRENEWDEPVVKLYDGDFDNASGETLDSAIDAAMRESGK